MLWPDKKVKERPLSVGKEMGHSLNWIFFSHCDSVSQDVRPSNCLTLKSKGNTAVFFSNYLSLNRAQSCCVVSHVHCHHLYFWRFFPLFFAILFLSLTIKYVWTNQYLASQSCCVRCVSANCGVWGIWGFVMCLSVKRFVHCDPRLSIYWKISELSAELYKHDYYITFELFQLSVRNPICSEMTLSPLFSFTLV